MVVGRSGNGVEMHPITELDKLESIKVVKRAGENSQEILDRTIRSVGQPGYNLVYNNCEQHCEVMHDDQNRIGQVGTTTLSVGSLVAATGLGVVAYNKKKKED